MRTELLARELIAAAHTVIAETHGNIDGRTGKALRRKPGDIADEIDGAVVAVECDGDPAFAEAIEANEGHDILSAVIARSILRRSNPVFACSFLDCFAALAMMPRGRSINRGSIP